MWYSIIFRKNELNKSTKIIYPDLDFISYDFSHEEKNTDAAINYAKEKLIFHIRKLNGYGLQIFPKDFSDYQYTINSDTDTIYKVDLPSSDRGRYSKILPNLSIFLFVMGVFFINISEILSIQTLPGDALTNTLFALVGGAFSASMTLFLYVSSNTKENFANVGRRIDNYFIRNKLTKEQRESLDFEFNEELNNRLVSQAISSEFNFVPSNPASSSCSPAKILSRLLLAIPPVGATTFRIIANYQNCLAIGEKLKDHDKLYVDFVYIEILAAIIASLDTINGLSFNLSFAFKAMPYLEDKLKSNRLFNSTPNYNMLFTNSDNSPGSIELTPDEKLSTNSPQISN